VRQLQSCSTPDKGELPVLKLSVGGITCIHRGAIFRPEVCAWSLLLRNVTDRGVGQRPILELSTLDDLRNLRHPTAYVEAFSSRPLLQFQDSPNPFPQSGPNLALVALELGAVEIKTEAETLEEELRV